MSEMTWQNLFHALKKERERINTEIIKAIDGRDFSALTDWRKKLQDVDDEIEDVLHGRKTFENPWDHDRLCRLIAFTIAETKKHGINLDGERSHDVLFNFCEQDYPEVGERPLSDYIITDRDGKIYSWDLKKLQEYMGKTGG